MGAAGWVDAMATMKKTCLSCRDDKTRQGFTRQQWRCSSPKCKSCTLHRAEQDRREVTLADFVPPAARPQPTMEMTFVNPYRLQPTMEMTDELSTECRRRSSRLKSVLSSRRDGRHGLPNSGWVKTDEEVKSYRVMPGAELQSHAGPGGDCESKDGVSTLKRCGDRACSYSRMGLLDIHQLRAASTRMGSADSADCRPTRDLTTDDQLQRKVSYVVSFYCAV